MRGDRRANLDLPPDSAPPPPRTISARRRNSEGPSPHPASVSARSRGAAATASSASAANSLGRISVARSAIRGARFRRALIAAVTSSMVVTSSSGAAAVSRGAPRRRSAMSRLASGRSGLVRPFCMVSFVLLDAPFDAASDATGCCGTGTAGRRREASKVERRALLPEREWKNKNSRKSVTGPVTSQCGRNRARGEEVSVFLPPTYATAPWEHGGEVKIREKSLGGAGNRKEQP